MPARRSPRSRRFASIAWLISGVFLAVIGATTCRGADGAEVERRLYVAAPGIRDYLEYGGHGLLVFDVDHDHRFLRRIATAGLNRSGKPNNVKGICASVDAGKLYVSTIQQLACLDLTTEKLLWERTYEGGCDRMSMTPDGRWIYLPSLEGPFWNVVRGEDGEVVDRLTLNSGAHNTVVGPGGDRAYLAGLKSPFLAVVDASSRKIVRQVGQFAAPVRPFTVNGRQTLCFVNVNELLGFEIGDLTTGRKLARVEVTGFDKGPIKRHGCPSHGIGLTPDEKEIWISDAHNTRLHVFDATASPPVQKASILLKDEPGWVTFSLDGRYAYPSTGDVIDVQTHAIVAQLKDENGRFVQSEKLMEIDFQDGRPVKAGDQFGLGRVVSP